MPLRVRRIAPVRSLAACAGLVAALQAQPLTRVAATSLRLPATPPPTTYATTRAFPTLASFTQPLALVTPPGETRRLFVVEKTGRIWVIPDVTAANPTRTLFLDLSGRVAVSADLNDERGLLALAFHPRYAANGQFYVWYTLNTTTGAGSGLHNRLARFRVSASNPNSADSGAEQPLLTQRDDASNHNGGELAFGPDGYLYLSLGDEGGGNDQFANSQRLDRDFFAGIVRLDVDLRAGSLAPNPHPAVHAGAYAIPGDNPFVGATSFNGASINPAAVRTEFWAVGLRNPWRFSFDPATGQLWCADVGQVAREEIDLIVRGGNYGWSYREGSLAGPRANPPAAANFRAPIWDYPRSEGASVTGGLVYRRNRIPALFGHYLFADFVSGRIWALQPDGENPVGASRVQLLATDGGIASFGLDPSNGDILLADLSEGLVKRLVASTGGGSAFPATLSATGAFASAAALTPAPGVVAYEPNVSFWSDHATKRRWFAIGDATSRFDFAADGAWSLPAGAVWIKHFDLELTRGAPSTARRVETRFLVKTATGVYGLSYRWNDTQTDATLVPDEGADATFNVSESGVTRAQAWRFPSRTECLACHTAAGGFALSFNTRQLNRAHVFPGGAANQIEALAAAGYLAGAPAAAAALPALARADDTAQPIEARARAYLDANCAQCHQPDGTALGQWDARASTPLAATGIIDGALVDNGGDSASRVLVPGDPARSRLLQRMLLRGAGQMPPLATSERDGAGEALLLEWIATLGTPQPPSRLINLAARAQVSPGAAPLIAGFVVADGPPKTVLVRGVGPALADFGVPGALAAPSLTLFGEGRTLATNTRWNTDPSANTIRAFTAQAGTFSLPEGSADSALLATLAPGNYTAQLTGVAGASGVALVEIYDIDPQSSAAPITRFTNLSVRAHVGSGASVLIPGLVIGEGAMKTVLIRAVGPGLAAFGVNGALAEPVVALHAGDARVATNAGWNSAGNADDIRATAERVGAFRLAEGSRDSALLVTLPRGAYTIHVSGVGTSTGAALVEVYEVR